jgi:hypothetical protein
MNKEFMMVAETEPVENTSLQRVLSMKLLWGEDTIWPVSPEPVKPEPGERKISIMDIVVNAIQNEYPFLYVGYTYNEITFIRTEIGLIPYIKVPLKNIFLRKDLSNYEANVESIKTLNDALEWILGKCGYEKEPATPKEEDLETFKRGFIADGLFQLITEGD